MSDDQAPRAQALPMTVRPHVVIVSDDPDLRDFLGQGLLLAGFWTSAIGSGLQVIEVLRLRRFDLILIDGRLRGLSATDVIRRVRASPNLVDGPLTTLPIAVVEAPNSATVRATLSEVGANTFLDAPLELDDIATRLLTLVLDWRAAHPDQPWADSPLPQARGPRGDEAG